MTEHTKEDAEKAFQLKLADLTSIYEDYLYMVREHEQLLLLMTSEKLAERFKKLMYPEGYNFSWNITPLNENEKKKFADFIANDFRGDGKKSYIVLQHIKDKENNGKPPVYTHFSYENRDVGLDLPSMIERYSISYPKGATFGSTEFLIDGHYKAVYTGEKEKNRPLETGLNDVKLLTEMKLMLKIGEALRKNGYVKDDKFASMVEDIYVDELMIINENNILEILGSFAEKVKDICNEKYGDKNNKKDNKNDSHKNFVKAQKDGFMKLPINFWDYVNIRNFMRHQWEGLDELESFMPKQITDDKQKRIDRVSAYLDFCGKPIFLRLKSYLKALHQMQRIIGEVNPNRIIRGVSEENEKFVKRVKAAYLKNPHQELKVEANYPLPSDEFLILGGDLAAISPNIKIVDDVPGFDCLYEDMEDTLLADKEASEALPDDENISEGNRIFEHMFARMEDYIKRSLFLGNFHTLECAAISHCIRHGRNCNEDGKNLTVRGAWDYLEKINVITRDDCEKWQGYTDLRRKVSHFYFSESLRNKLSKVGDKYYTDLLAIAKKLDTAAPVVTKKGDGIFEYKNVDGHVVVLDHNRHKILSGLDAPKPEEQNQKDSQKKDKADEKTYTVSYRNGVSFELNKETNWIESVKLPNGVAVNFGERSIDFDDRTHWYSDAESFNALKTVGSMVMTDKDMAVLKYKVGSEPADFENKEKLLIDYTHTLWLERGDRLKKFEFKQSKDNVIVAEFKKTQKGQNLIELNDGTGVLMNGKNMAVFHGNCMLRNNNRAEFAKSYDKALLTLDKFIKRGNGRL